jgi:hypothetical protein
MKGNSKIMQCVLRGKEENGMNPDSFVKHVTESQHFIQGECLKKFHEGVQYRP